MILVLVGTNPYSFDRLVKAVDDYAGVKNEEVFIQLGYTKYKPKHAKYAQFLEKPALLKKIEEAELVVAQGGFGGIADCLALGKKVIAVPRKPDLGESPDDQEEIVRALERENRLTGVYKIEDLETAIEKARGLSPQPTLKSRIPEILNDFIASQEK